MYYVTRWDGRRLYYWRETDWTDDKQDAARFHNGGEAANLAARLEKDYPGQSVGVLFDSAAVT